MKAAIFLVVLGMVFAFLPSARAGQGILLPNAVNSVLYAVAFSYPDTMKDGENYTISMNMAVLFNNVSVSNINIMQIDVFVVPESEKPTSTNHEMAKYFFSEEWTDDFSNPLYVIHKAKLGETVVANFNDMRLIEGNPIDEKRTGKIYVEVQFQVETDLNSYPLIYYSDAGEMPRVQLLPSEQALVADPFTQNIGLIAALTLGIGGCLMFLLAIRLRRLRFEKLVTLHRSDLTG